MSATGMLRRDHELVMRLERAISRCCAALGPGGGAAPADVARIARLMYEFVDAVHHSREEGSYFPCAGAGGGFAAEVRAFLIEHQFGRNVARQVSRHLRRWEGGEDARADVARFLRAYAAYLRDHVGREERFFDEAERSLDGAEEAEMYEYFAAAAATARSTAWVEAELCELEARPWCGPAGA